MEPQKNLGVIELLRGLAAFVVMLFHFGEGTDITPGWYHDTFRYGGSIGVVTFFVISGFVIPLQLERRSYSLLKAKQFLLNRFIRIYPNLLVCILLALVLGYVQISFIEKNEFIFSWKQLLANLTLSAPHVGQSFYVAVFWTLAIEFVLYVFLAVFNKPLFKMKGASCIFIFVLPLLPILFEVDGDRDNFLRWLPHFCFGFSLFKFFALNQKISAVTLLVISAIALSICNRGNAFLHLGTCLSTVVLIATVKCEIPIMFKFLGQISYSLYLYHNVVGRRFFSLVERLTGGDSDMFFIMNMILSCLVSVVFSYVMYLLIEKKSHQISKTAWKP